MHHVIIIGGGPAGVSASLYTSRANIKTTIIAKDGGALEKTDKIENYYGFETAISGPDLLANGRAQAKGLGVEIVQAQVVGLGFSEKLIVKTTDGEHMADCVILATGLGRNTPKIDGLSTFEGQGISYCAVCDAFFYRQKDVAVLGGGEYALSEVMELLPVAKSVTLLTNENEITASFPPEVAIVEKKISAFVGGSFLEQIRFLDQSTMPIDGVFVALGVASSSDLAKKIGAQIAENKIVVNQSMQTTIPGVYAAGDCTGGMLQIAKAVFEGAQAGLEVVKHLRKQASKQ